MNKYFINPNDTDTIELDGGQEWVKVKKTLSIGDQDRLSEMLFNVKIDTTTTPGLDRGSRRRQAKENPGANMDARFKPSTAALLEIAILEWSFKTEVGIPLPLTRANIDLMRPEWANMIEENIDILNPLVEPSTLVPTETP